MTPHRFLVEKIMAMRKYMDSEGFPKCDRQRR